MLEIIHPILVHIPIAFLGAYFILELIWSKRLRHNTFYWKLKTFLVVVGALGAAAAALTGDAAEHAMRRTANVHALVELHSTFAIITLVLSLILAGLYIVGGIEHFEEWKRVKAWAESSFGSVWKFKVSIMKFVLETPFVYLVALIGLILIFATGALGGAIVYGVSDPIAKLLVAIFLKQ